MIDRREFVEVLDTKLRLTATLCALCLYAQGDDEAKPALTVIEGYAVCDDHMGYVAQGERFAGILRAVRREG